MERTKKNRINLDEAEFVGWHFDKIGKIIFWKGQVLRGIYKHAVPKVDELLHCGLVDELTQNNLLPQTAITDYKIEGFGKVLRHERISPIIYPNQWCFSMFKDAALALIKVNQIAMKHGYQTIDGHGFNILFKRNHPVFIDLGSFVKIRPDFKGWNGYEEFLSFFYYPLKIFAGGNAYIARSILNQGVAKKWIPPHAYYHYKHPSLRTIRPHIYQFIFKTYYRYKNISFFSDKEIILRSPPQLGKKLVWLRKYKLLPFQKISFNRLAKKISRINLKKYKTDWSDYYVTGDIKKGEVLISERFERIIEILKPHPVKTVLEFGGNKGVFARALMQSLKIDRVICTDYDELAVDNMYNEVKNTNFNIVPVVLDFSLLTTTSYGMPHYERFRSDLVIGLALTHHLILSQRVPLERILSIFYQYSKKYVLLEFMPLGLYSEKSKYPPPPVPEWYTLKWFQSNFEKYFNIIRIEHLEKNRIIIFGVKKQPINK